MITGCPHFAKSTIRLMLKALIILGFFDLVATIYWISVKLAVEANPIMNYFIELSIPGFAIAKLALMFSGIFVLNHFKDKKSNLVFFASLLLVLIYWIIGVWHLFGAIRLLL